MTESANDQLVIAHRHCTENRAEVERSTLCGCFYCLETFPPGEVTDWIESEDTALCPKCGIDAVLANRTGLPVAEPEFLGAMHRRWFER
jgi:hypothetical protein